MRTSGDESDARFRTLRRIRTFLFAYGWASIGVGGMILANVPASMFFGLGQVLVILALGSYTAISGFLMLKARKRIIVRDPDAPRLTALAMGLAIPGSLFFGAGWLAFLIDCIVNFRRFGIVAGVPLTAVCFGSFVVLWRVLYRIDLDELLWAGAGEEIDESLNFVENDDEVVLDTASVESAVVEQAEA